ncbi:ribbon-helix-helix domain-containing protein [Patescibacteria group bacterium]|nr:ribbon-helix-helix domain-containing protein [Patescibacteria group bacterium]
MLRTQIYLPEDLRQEIDAVARKEKKPAAQVIRELLVEGVSNKHSETAGAAMRRLVALKVKGGPPDLSTHLDKYLYE